MRFRIKLETAILLFLLGGALSATAQQAQNTSTDVAGGKPNIVFILVDNVGWGNFGAPFLAFTNRAFSTAPKDPSTLEE